MAFSVVRTWSGFKEVLTATFAVRDYRRRAIDQREQQSMNQNAKERIHESEIGKETGMAASSYLV